MPTILQAGGFADEHCTKPTVAVDSSCDDTPKLVRLESGVFRSTRVARAYVAAGSSCQSIDPPPGGRFVAATDERVSDADLVAFEPRDVDVGARLRIRLLVGSDGSRYYAGLHDTAFDTECAFEVAGDGVVRCLPRPTAWALDETCTHRVVGYRAGTTPPRVVTMPRTGETRCDGLHSFRTTELGVTQLMQIDSTGKCVPSFSPPVRSPAVRVDDEVPPASFEPESRVRIGDGRVTQWVRTIGSARVPSTLEDRELVGPCLFLPNDGAFRCAPRSDSPRSSVAALIYADAACTNGVLCMKGGCGEPGRFMFESTSSCGWTLRSVGAATPPPAATFQSTSGGCFATPGPTCDSYHEVGAVIPASSLASGTVVVE